MLMQSLRMTRRDWRAGELRFLLLALVVAVAAMSSVGFFVDRMRAGLERDAHQLLGADVVIRADEPIPKSFIEEAQQRQLQTAQTTVFPSMATVGEGEQSRSKLASIKAVTDAYPLRGKLKVATHADAESAAADGIPDAGTLWVDSSLMNSLKLAVGDSLKLGNKVFSIAKILTFEPDRGAGFMSFAPRVMLAASDLPATGLVQFGSRIQYRLLVAGRPDPVASFNDWAENNIQQNNLKGMRTETLESGQMGMRATLQRAEEFLSLVGLLSAMLAAVAVAMAARRFMLRHVDACAMLRCLGLTQHQLTMLYLSEFLMVGLVGSTIGVAIGFAAHFVLASWLGSLMTVALPSALSVASLTPALQGMATGLLLLLGFAVPPILQLRNVPHNRVLRREADTPQPATLVTYALGLLVFIALLLWQAGNVRLGLLTAAGFVGGLAFFTLLAWLFLKLLRTLRHRVRNASTRFAITALQRRPGATILQIVALALGLMALLLLTVIRGDLVTAWRNATPADAPNRFVINIQPEQKATIAARLKENGINGADLYPMIRGRLLAINDTPITDQSFVEDRAKRLVDREFNLSTMIDIPVKNKIVAGRWYDNSKPEASVEEGLAKTLNLQVGDRLTFDIAGEKIIVPITSLRKLDWGSMRVNFFVVINPAAMKEMPQTWITAFNLPASQDEFENRLTSDFPNLTVIDVGSVLRQIQSMIEQVVTAVEFLFLFTLLSGVLVLYAALASSQDQRTREAGLLRALGATRKQLSRAQWIEFFLVGCVAGLLAAGGATAVGWSLAYFVFDFAWVFSPWVWIAGCAVGATCAFVGGWLSLRNVLNQPPLQTLREA